MGTVFAFLSVPFAFFGLPLTTVLVGLGAASIPIIIHLLNRRRYQVVVWAAMQFLLNAQKKNTRRMRLEQLILLALRTLLIILLVLAMASVMTWSEEIWAQIWPDGAGFVKTRSGRVHKVIVLDASLSMNTRLNLEKSYFDVAREKAMELVKDSQPGDAFSVALMKDSPVWTIADISADGNKVIEEIKLIEPAHGNANVANTLNMVASKLSESPKRFQRREVYFITDMQKATWLTGEGKVEGKKAENAHERTILQDIQKKAQTIFVDVGGDKNDNLAVTNLRLGQNLITTGMKVPVIATIKNFGSKAKQQLRVELFAGKARESDAESKFTLSGVGRQLIDIQRNVEATVSFTHTFTKPGTYALQVRLEGDDLEPDDRRTVVVQVKDEVPILLVDGNQPGNKGTEFLELAINPLPRFTPLRPTVISTSLSQHAKQNLDKYDCIILCDVNPDVNRLDERELRHLENHLHRGGGVIISMGSNAANYLKKYNDVFYREGKGVLPAKLLGVQQAVGKKGDEQYYFTPFGEEETFRRPPLLAFAAEYDKIALRTVHINKYVRAKPVLDGRVRTILTLMPETVAEAANIAKVKLPINDPLLLSWNPPLPEEKRDKANPKTKLRNPFTRYRGKVVLMTTTFNMDWTTWPGSPSYLPLVQELIRHAVSGRFQEQSTVVDQPLEEYLSTNGTELDVHLHLPGELVSRPKQVRTDGRGDVTVFRWYETDQSGIYWMTVGQDVKQHLFAVNVPAFLPNQKASESDLSRISESKLNERYPGWEFQVVKDLSKIEYLPMGEGQDEEIVRGRMGPVIANILLIAVLILLITEVVLAFVFGHFSSVPGARSEPASNKRAWPMGIGITAGILFVGIFSVLLHAAITGDFFGFLPDSFRSGVEALLKIPPPAPGEGSRWALEFTPFFSDPTTDLWLSAVIAVGAIVLLVLIYMREGFSIPAAYKFLLGGLRFFLILLTLAVLLPQLQLNFERRSWPDVVLLIDDSLSMGETDQYQEESVQETVAKLTKKIRENYKEELPKKIEHLEEKLSKLEQDPDGKAEEILKLKTEKKELLDLKEQVENNPNWQPTRLQLVQAVVKGKEKSWIRALLEDRRMKVHVYHLDREGRAIKVMDSQGNGADLTELGKPKQAGMVAQAIANLKPRAEESRLGTAVRQVLDYYRGSSLSAIIMLTDGVTTREEDLQKISRYAYLKGVGLHLVGIGDDHELRDLKLHDLQVEDTVYVNDRVIFEARLTGKGYKNLTVPVVLKMVGKNGEPTEVAREMVTIDPQGKPVRVRLKYRPIRPGERLFIVEVVPPFEEDDEKKPKNANLRLERTILVQESKVNKVLYVEGSPRYEFRFIKNLLEREKKEANKKKSVDLKVFLLEGDEKFPSQDRTAISEFPFTKEELSSFDVVILGDVDPRHPKLGEQKMRNLANFVRGGGGGLLVIAGSQFAPHSFKNTPLEDIIPVEPATDRPPLENANLEEGYHLELTAVGRLHPIFRFSPDDTENQKIWQELKPMYWWAKKLKVKPLAEVLAVHPKKFSLNDQNKDVKLPLVVQHYVGSGRCMFFGFDESWRWRFRKDVTRFNHFWNQTVRYLSRNRLSRTDLRLDRQTPYRQGEPIKVTVRFPDNTPIPGQVERVKAGMKTDVKVIAEHRPPEEEGKGGDVEVQTLKLAKVEGSWATYEGVLARTREGKYRFWLSNPDVSQSQPNKKKPSAEARVILPPGELDRLRMNREELQIAAKDSNGKFYDLATAQNLVDELPSGYRVALNTPGKPRMLWNHALTFLLVIGLLTSEWFLRKRKHLL